MTFIEKLKIEHPDKICYANDKINYGSIDLGCPDEYGYEPKTGTGCSTKRPCAECWNREIPEDEHPMCLTKQMRQDKLNDRSSFIGKFYGDLVGIIGDRDKAYELTKMAFEKGWFG